MVSKTRTASSHPNGDGPKSSRSTGTPAANIDGQHISENSPKTPKNNKPKKKHKGLWWKILLGVIGAILVIGGATFAYLYATTKIPNPEDTALASKTTVYYSDGTTKIGSFAEENREIINCSTLPNYVGDAIVSSEDRSFYTNKGIDLGGIARALWNNITTGSRQGGSTLTQQYAERYYLGETTSYLGKLHEAVLAIKLAHTQDKSTILCNYMNTVYFGNGAYGIQAAAQTYYGVDAKDLTVDQAATLAGIIPAPSTWNPYDNPKQAESRYDRVIRIMKEDGYITAKQAQDAKYPEPIPLKTFNDFAGPNGYLLTTVENELVGNKAFTKEELETGGYKIITTLDKSMQSQMQAVGDERPAGMPESIQVGGIATDPRDGSVKAMYGGSDFLAHQLNNSTQATFQPGSTMKPFGLLGAAQDDVSFNTLFNGNSGLEFETTPGVYADVPNALNMSYGNINLYTATAKSVNTVFMNVNEHLTPEKYAKIVKEAGITSKINPDTLYNILGINSITAWDLAQGHSTIAGDGVKHTLHVVATVSKDKNTLYKAKDDATRVFDANDCALVQKAMLGTTSAGGTAPTLQYEIGRPIAGKSGTANDETAASFVGYVPQLLNVWAIWNPGEDGSAQQVPAFDGWGVSSTGYPSHLCAEFMRQALEGQEVLPFPTAEDTGKIGGPEGNWGIGGGSSAATQQQAVPQTTENNNDSKDKESTTTGDGDKKETEQQTQPAPQPSPTTPVTPTQEPTTPAVPSQEPSTGSTIPSTEPTTPGGGTGQNPGQNPGQGGTRGGTTPQTDQKGAGE